MNSKLIFLLLSFVSCIFFSSCVATSGISRTSSIMAPTAGFNNLKTFAWYQEKPAGVQDFEKGYRAELDAHLRRAIEEELQRRGYRKASSNPAMLVAYDVSVSVPIEKDTPGAYPPGFGYGYAYMAGYRYNYRNTNMPGYRAVDLFKKGTLIIDFIEPASNELLWRGWSEEGLSNFNANYKKVRNLVGQVIGELGSSY